MIIGGQAVLLYREPRFTNDIDITLGIDADKAEELLNILTDNNLASLVSEPGEFVNQTMVLPVYDNDTKIRIDFIFSNTEFEREAIKRCRKVKIDDTLINFCSLEDILIHKLFAGRERDNEDIRQILVKNPIFDKSYLIKQLRVLQSLLDIDYVSEFERILNNIKRK